MVARRRIRVKDSSIQIGGSLAAPEAELNVGPSFGQAAGDDATSVDVNAATALDDVSLTGVLSVASSVDGELDLGYDLLNTTAAVGLASIDLVGAFSTTQAARLSELDVSYTVKTRLSGGIGIFDDATSNGIDLTNQGATTGHSSPEAKYGEGIRMSLGGIVSNDTDFYDHTGDLCITAACDFGTLSAQSIVGFKGDSTTGWALYVTNGRLRYVHRRSTGNYVTPSGLTDVRSTFGTVTLRRDVTNRTIEVKLNGVVEISDTWGASEDPVAVGGSPSFRVGSYPTNTNVVVDSVYEVRLWKSLIPQATLDVIADPNDPTYTTSAEGNESSIYYFEDVGAVPVPGPFFISNSSIALGSVDLSGQVAASSATDLASIDVAYDALLTGTVAVDSVQYELFDIPASVDTWVGDTSGCLGDNSNHNGEALFVEGNVATRKKSLIGWDLTNLPGNATVEEASIELTTNLLPLSSTDVELTLVAEAGEGWVETTVQCDDKPAEDGSATTASTSITGTLGGGSVGDRYTISIDVAAALTRIGARMGTGRFSLYVEGSSGAGNQVRFDSLDTAATAADYPTLNLRFTVPTA